jgi:hypothetical protein
MSCRAGAGAVGWLGMVDWIRPCRIGGTWDTLSVRCCRVGVNARPIKYLGGWSQVVRGCGERKRRERLFDSDPVNGCPSLTTAPWSSRSLCFCHSRSCSAFHARAPYKNTTHAPTMRPSSTPPSGALLAANVCGVSTLALLDPTALFDRKPPRLRLPCEAPRGFFVGSRVAITCNA